MTEKEEKVDYSMLLYSIYWLFTVICYSKCFGGYVLMLLLFVMMVKEVKQHYCSQESKCCISKFTFTHKTLTSILLGMYC